MIGLKKVKFLVVPISHQKLSECGGQHESFSYLAMRCNMSSANRTLYP